MAAAKHPRARVAGSRQARLFRGRCRATPRPHTADLTAVRPIGSSPPVERRPLRRQTRPVVLPVLNMRMPLDVSVSLLTANHIRGCVAWRGSALGPDRVLRFGAFRPASCLTQLVPVRGLIRLHGYAIEDPRITTREPSPAARRRALDGHFAGARFGRAGQPSRRRTPHWSGTFARVTRLAERSRREYQLPVLVCVRPLPAGSCRAAINFRRPLRPPSPSSLTPTTVVHRWPNKDRVPGWASTPAVATS